MGRRKKETPDFHRGNMAAAAEKLFIARGIAATTMDDIAKAAGYSKATLYVYFTNKEEIVAALVLKSMEMLYERIQAGISAGKDTGEKYYAICNELVSYQEEFPFYFEIALGEINIDFQKSEALNADKETFEIGELIISAIASVITDGIADNTLRKELQIQPVVFFLWASLSGLINMAAQKYQYIKKSMGMTKREFLDYGFNALFHSIQAEGHGDE